MLFWIFVAASVICITALIVMKLKNFNAREHYISAFIIVFVTAVLIVITGIMGFFIAHTKNTSQAYTAAMEKRYESLTYQLEQDIFTPKSLYDQVQHWNEDLASGKIMQDNVWIGIFYRHVYDRFDFIELP